MPKPTFEQDLIAMVTSLVHLRTVGEQLRKKEFVTARAKSCMSASASAFADLLSSFERTEETLQQDAQPALSHWLAELGAQLGGGACFEGCSGGRIARVQGRLSSVRLYPKQPSGMRWVEMILDDTSFATDQRPAFAPFDAFMSHQLSPVNDTISCSRFGVVAGDYRASSSTADVEKVDRFVMSVRMPIKQDLLRKFTGGATYLRLI